MEFSQKTKVVSAYLLCTLVWSTTWFAIRVTIGPGGFPTYEAAALRFSIAVVVLALFTPRAMFNLKQRLDGQLKWLCLAGLINSVSYGLLYKGEESVTGSVAAVLFGSLPLVAAVFAAVTRTERISLGQVGGALVALAGITMLFWERLSVSRRQAAGVALVLVAVFVNASYLLLFRSKIRGRHSMAATAIFLGATGTGLWCIALARGWQPLPWPPPAKPALALLYLGVFGSVVTFACYLYLLRHVSVVTVSTIIIAESGIALAVDRAWERDFNLGPLAYLGAAVTLAGFLASILLRPAGLRGDPPPS
jgi:drug/metabolite transporter (DMT)-like permease